MPRIERSADIVWEGNVARGGGTISARSGAFTDLPFTVAEVSSRSGACPSLASPFDSAIAKHAA